NPRELCSFPTRRSSDLLIGAVYVIKNIVAAAEVFYQNFSIQKMCYHFKNRILARYTDMDYGLFLTRNSSYGVNVVSGDAERVYRSEEHTSELQSRENLV